MHACQPCTIAGVMACSQELHKGDLVAVSVAMEAAGREGYVTRGSILGSDLSANTSLYVGESQSHIYLLQQRASWTLGCFAGAQHDQATRTCCRCQPSCCGSYSKSCVKIFINERHHSSRLCQQLGPHTHQHVVLFIATMLPYVRFDMLHTMSKVVL